MRILHFSDPHLHLPLSQVPFRSWFSKRSIGALNLLRGRGKRFDRAEEKLAALAAFRRQQDIELVICTGDYTALGLEQELANAHRVVEPLMQGQAGYITVPGNHDLYVQEVVRENWFFRYFQDSMKSDLPQYCVQGAWPQVRLIGDDLAVIAVNSSKPNLPWRSDGSIPEQQLSALDRLLDDEQLTGRFIMVMTHYAARMPNGEPDTRLHGLANADDYLSVCSKIKQGALLCGHIHHRYQVAIKGLAANLFCAGSATLEGRESFWLYELNEGQFHAYPGYWDGHAYQIDR